MTKPSLFRNIEDVVEKKPTWRGWLHTAMVPVALIAGIILLIGVQTTGERIAAAIYMLSTLLLFSVSAVYHRFYWNKKADATLRRMDHANIFLLISGTYTPVAVMALDNPSSTILLTIAWAGAVVGILFRMFWLGAPRWLYTILYIALGWAALFFLPEMFASHPATVWLLLAGGIAYTLGAVAYGLKKPNLIPGVFGFHELFHAATVIAFFCHWTAVFLLVF